VLPHREGGLALIPKGHSPLSNPISELHQKLQLPFWSLKFCSYPLFFSIRLFSCRLLHVLFVFLPFSPPPGPQHPVACAVFVNTMSSPFFTSCFCSFSPQKSMSPQILCLCLIIFRAPTAHLFVRRFLPFRWTSGILFRQRQRCTCLRRELGNSFSVAAFSNLVFIGRMSVTLLSPQVHFSIRISQSAETLLPGKLPAPHSPPQGTGQLCTPDTSTLKVETFRVPVVSDIAGEEFFFLGSSDTGCPPNRRCFVAHGSYIIIYTRAPPSAWLSPVAQTCGLRRLFL